MTLGQVPVGQDQGQAQTQGEDQVQAQAQAQGEYQVQGEDRVDALLEDYIRQLNLYMETDPDQLSGYIGVNYIRQLTLYMDINSYWETHTR